MATHDKVFVLGIDGATFELISPWCEQGRLPHISQLLGKAAFGTLQSTPETSSAQAWSSFMTGLNPGNHGLYYFLKHKKNSYNFELTNASDRDGKALWRIASEGGRRCIVVNVPMTYPPEEINGILISGMDAPGMKSGFTYPRGLYDELTGEIGEYIIESDASKIFRQGDYVGALGALERTLDNRHKTVRYLMGRYPWDLFVVVFTETDRVQHHFWRFMDKAHLLYNENENEDVKNAILRIYQKVDSIIGSIREILDENTTFIVMSDHGAGPSSNRTVYINKWLNSLGLLVYKDEGVSNPLKLLYSRIRSASLWRLHLMLKRLLPRGTKDLLRRYCPGLSNKIRSYGYSLDIDWGRTKAFSTETTPSIRLNVKGKYPCGIVEAGQEYEEIRTFIIEQLRDLRDPETQKEVVGEIHKKEKIYRGKYLGDAPDIVFGWKNCGYTNRFSQSAPGDEPIQILSAKDLAFAESFSGRTSGVHTPEGIMIIHGRTIRKGWRVAKAAITDLAPTILHILGIAIPLNMDGRVISEAFEEGYIRENTPKYVDEHDDEGSKGQISYSDQERGAIEERLRGLGYIE